MLIFASIAQRAKSDKTGCKDENIKSQNLQTCY
jgi:hypothetical protein